MLRKHFPCTAALLLLVSLSLHAQTPTVPTPQQTDQIITDPNANGKADPGDKIRYKVTIQNTGAGNATGVKLNAIPDSRTTLDLLSFRTSPLAMPDGPYSCIGNVGITVPDGASDLLGNDYDDAPGGLTASAGTFATTQGGSITIAANGSFSYNPPRGYEGSDTYEYTLNDGNAVLGVTATNTAIITFTVSGMIWFINNNGGACASTCDGRMSNPYTSLSAFNTANDGLGLNPADNDNIFLYESATAYTGGIVLRAGQKLIGQDATVTVTAAIGLPVLPFTTPLPTTNSGNGTKATITNTTVGGNGITLSTGNTLRGLTVGNTATTGTGAGINGNGIGALTINEVSKNGTGQILTLNNGSVNASFIELSTTSTIQTAIVLSNISAGSVTDVDGSGSSISGASGAFSISGPAFTNVVSLTFNGDVTHTGTNPLVFVQNHGTGTITFQNGTLGSTVGSINFTNADGTYNFNGTTTLSGASHITIDGGSSGSFNFNSNTSVTNPTNIAFDVNGSNATVDYNGTLSSNTAFQLIDIANNTGGSVSFDGNLTFTGNAVGIRLQQNSSGTYSFNASSKTISSGANTAVNLVINAGATINFTNGGLVINTTSGTGFNATGGGTVTVQGTGNKINNTTGPANTNTATALNVVSTTIGASGLTFESIASGNNSAAADPANGIVLNTTGSGELTVTGTGSTDGTGGTIQNTTGRGASLISASNITLKNMNFTNAGTSDLDADNSGLSTGDNLATNAAIHLQSVTTATLDNLNINGGAEQGINGNAVSNFTLSNSSIVDAGNGADEDGVHFYNMSGTSAITNTTINCTVVTPNTTGGDDHLNLQMQSGTLNLTISGGSATNANKGSGYLFGIRGTANATITFSSASSTTNFSGGIVADAFDDATMNLTVTNSTSSGNNDQLSVSAGDNSDVDLNASGNTLSSTNTADFVVVSLLGSAFDNGFTLDAILNDNDITVGNGLAADGIFIFNAGGGAIKTSITNNTIDYAGTQRAIAIQVGQDGNGSTNVTITGNNIDIKLDGTGNAVTGILAQSAITGPGNTSSLCADIGGAGALTNTFTHSLGGSIAGGDIRVRQRNDGTVRLPGYAGGATDLIAVVNYLNGRNVEVSSSTATADSSGFAGGAACSQP